MKIATISTAMWLTAASCQAFVTPTTRLQTIQQQHTKFILRETDEINKEAVIEEETDAVEPVESAATVAETPVATTPIKSSKVISADRINKAIKERAYPFFLAEKAFSMLDSSHSSLDSSVGGVGNKEHLIVLGTGWGAASFLKNIDTDKYDVTVISPRNYFVFTPMLAGASVGTVDFKSITEPIREINNKVRYLEAAANEINPLTQSISCTSIVCEGNSCETESFDISYDRLLFSVGAQTTTFGTPGVEEYCNYLKQVGDAQQIKNAIVNCFESAGLPNLTEEDMERELTFVIVGAGPTGIEFAAELLDFIESDGPRYYKDRLKYVRIKVVEAAPSILRPFEDGMKEEAIRRLTRTIKIQGMGSIQPCEVLLNKQVSEVTEQYIYFKDGERIPYGMSLWAAGIGQLPITSSLVEELKGTEQTNAQQYARGRLAVDPWLRVLGGDGKIFALGDCSCISSTPMLPATAQVAAQQGEFLGKLLSRDYVTNAMGETLLPPMAFDPNQPKMLSEQIASFAMGENEIAAPFQFLDLGILAYTGSGSALAQVQIAPGKDLPGANENWSPVRLQIKGSLGFGLWRTIYLLKQTSFKNVVLVALDWVKVNLFGRDISIL